MKTIIIFFVSFFISCKGKNETSLSEKGKVSEITDISIIYKESVKNKKTDTLYLQQTEKHNEFLEILGDSVKRRMLNIEDIKILSKEKKFLHWSSDKDTLACQKWKLSDQSIKFILKNGEPIDNRTFHYAFDVYCCVFEGKLKYKNEIIDYQINAGSWIDIGNDKTSLRMGYFKKDALKKGFFSTPESNLELDKN